MMKLNKKVISSVLCTSLIVLAHVAVILAALLSFRYYAVYPSLFVSILVIVVCIMIIIDIIYFVGFSHKALALKILCCTLAFFVLLGGSVGTYFLGKANAIVDTVLNTSDDKYETYSGVFAYYDKNSKFTALTDLKGKTVGMLNETSNGLSYIAKGLLDEAKVDYARIDYNTNAELIQALIDGDIDAMVITSAYKEIYSLERDENSPFAEYLDNFVNFYTFEKDLKVNKGTKAKNISTEPFNVLLIGYSRTDIGSPIGLADSIILATINPQTYTVSMMSIARDSFVPIPCYGGEYDKINSPRSTSRQAFIETVENFLDLDIDYYMELDYLGLVEIVNTIGGIVINNPVEFELDGVYVPEGEFNADGQQVLQFCRERHHMPGGDFDRQQHQKEAIISIAQKFISSGDISLALRAMENAAPFMSTDLTLNQLTTIFNLLLNTKNYTSLDTFDLVDFQTLRITGSGGIMYYSYSMRLPLWVYLIYQGSYDESMQHVYDTMGMYENVKQDKSFNFSIRKKYEAPPLYSLTYPEVFLYTPDPMPAFWANLSGMTPDEALAWANEKGVKLSIDYINFGDPEYDESLQGLVVGQSTRYGQLVSDFPTGTITVMGAAEVDESKVVPYFVGHGYNNAIEWAEKYGIPYSIDFDPNVSGDVGKVVEQEPTPFTAIEKCDKLKIVVKAGAYTIAFDNNGHGNSSEIPSSITVLTGDKVKGFSNMSNSNETDANYIFMGWYTEASGGKQVVSTADVQGANGSTIKVYAHWSALHTVTFMDGDTTVVTKQTTDAFPGALTKVGYAFKGWFTEKTGGTEVKSFEGITKNTTLYAQWVECTDHTWNEGVVTTEPGCETKGVKTYTCSKCGATRTEEIDALGHDFSVDIEAVDPTCGKAGHTAGKACSRCGAADPGHTSTEISATGVHDYDDNGECTVCGAKDPDYIEPVDE